MKETIFMKKISFSLYVIIIACITFSCVITTKVGTVFDDSIPAEQSAEICFYLPNTIATYNGITVNWKQNVMETIQIPAGETQLVWGDFEAYVGNTIYRAKNINRVFVYNFQPRKKYVLMSWVEINKEGDQKYGMKVSTYDPEDKIKFRYTDEHFTGFFPFVDQPGSQKTVLE